ncbi:MAG TPA: 30S ribosomal protein S18 [Desulfotomaculum sp.]|nr:30S ribosomal protein S18 [Desulfotomaculum sp.]
MGNLAFKKEKGRKGKRRICSFCMDKVTLIDYKDVQRLKKYVTERGKILPRRVSGNCARHQRILTVAIKRARIMALVPFTVE